MCQFLWAGSVSQHDYGAYHEQCSIVGHTRMSHGTREGGKSVKCPARLSTKPVKQLNRSRRGRLYWLPGPVVWIPSNRAASSFTARIHPSPIQSTQIDLMVASALCDSAQYQRCLCSHGLNSQGNNHANQQQ